MSSEGPDGIDRFAAKLEAARERIESKRLAPGEGGRKPSAYGYGARLGIEILAGILVGLGIGWLLDSWLGSRPWLMLVFMLLGMAAGVLNVLRIQRQMDRRAEMDAAKE